MTLHESLTKAAQTANLLASDLLEAFKAANSLDMPPQGRSIGDLATTAYLSELLAAARVLESRIIHIAPRLT